MLRRQSIFPDFIKGNAIPESCAQVFALPGHKPAQYFRRPVKRGHFVIGRTEPVASVAGFRCLGQPQFKDGHHRRPPLLGSQYGRRLLVGHRIFGVKSVSRFELNQGTVRPLGAGKYAPELIVIIGHTAVERYGRAVAPLGLLQAVHVEPDIAEREMSLAIGRAEAETFLDG